MNLEKPINFHVGRQSFMNIGTCQHQPCVKLQSSKRLGGLKYHWMGRDLDLTSVWAVEGCSGNQQANSSYEWVPLWWWETLLQGQSLVQCWSVQRQIEAISHQRAHLSLMEICQKTKKQNQLIRWKQKVSSLATVPSGVCTGHHPLE